ncbi:VCBS repeat-containing protein [Nocardiopsis tropica]|uniref:FG-GAP repeat domain-containing protein n=1 Tax=Nocardiopsis tropica TaxID=109330 RepID=UPI0031D98E90
MPFGRLAVPACVGAILLTGACAGASGAPAAGSSEEPAPGASPVPEGRGGDVADDVNGDGFPDLLFLSSYTEDEDGLEGDMRLVVVHGSRNGPEPTTRAVFEAGVVGAGASVGGGNRLRPGTADLDGDGYADIPVLTGFSPGSLGASVSTYRPGIVWGGPTGPDPQEEPGPVSVPGGSSGVPGSPVAAPTPGDFDGDGHADLAVAVDSATGADAAGLVVLYGPFDREGEPGRTARRPVAAWIGELVAAPAGPGGGPAPLLVRHGSDGEQPANTLLVTGPGDPAGWDALELLPGSLSAFGDFDGDGETDVAVGDDGTRNDEPGHGTEPDEVDGRMNVYRGPFGTQAPEPLPVPLTATEPSISYHQRTVAACDLDGDGADTLAVGLAGHGVDLLDEDGGEFSAAGGPPLVRSGPEDGPRGADSPAARTAEAFACADHDADGSDELVLAYDPGVVRSAPVRWWVTDGDADEGAFDSGDFGG